MHELSQGRIPYGSGGVRLPVDVLQTVGHEVLQYAAQQHVEQEGAPQRVVADQRREGEEDGEVDDRRQNHRVAHDPRAGRADHDAVHQKGERTGDRNGDDPADVIACRCDDVGR